MGRVPMHGARWPTGFGVVVEVVHGQGRYVKHVPAMGEQARCQRLFFAVEIEPRIVGECLDEGPWREQAARADVKARDRLITVQWVRLSLIHRMVGLEQ